MGILGLDKENSTFNEQNDNLSGGFVELSSLHMSSRQGKDPGRKLEPVVVTTVTSEESGETKHIIEDTEKALAFDIFPKSTKASIQMGMTLLFILLLPAVFLTITSNPEYAFVIGIFWFILVSLFIGLIWVVRSVMLNDSRAQVFHPIVHAVAERIIQEFTDFRDDIRQEIHLIADGSVDDEYVKGSESSSQPKEQTTTRSTRKRLMSGNQRRPKSAIFRTVIQPLLPLVRRRKRRQNKEGDGSYDPPSSFV